MVCRHTTACKTSSSVAPGPGGYGGGFSWYPDDQAFFAEMETGASGYGIFDAIAGAPGTFISYNVYGRVSFGFSYDL
jgi:hypothetical protein